jgi:hypothetical protein
MANDSPQHLSKTFSLSNKYLINYACKKVGFHVKRALKMSNQNESDGIQQFLDFSNTEFQESLAKLHRHS